MTDGVPTCVGVYFLGARAPERIGEFRWSEEAGVTWSVLKPDFSHVIESFTHGLDSPGERRIVGADDGPDFMRALTRQRGTSYYVVVDESEGPAQWPEPRRLAPVSYFGLLLGESSSRDNPSGLVRRTHSDPPTDEVFRRDGWWHPTEYLKRYRLGHIDTDHVEIGRDEAMVILNRWLIAWRLEDAAAATEGDARSPR